MTEATARPAFVPGALFDRTAALAPAFDIVDEGVHRLVVDAPAFDSPTYREFLEALGVATYTTDSHGRITFFNEAAARLWGRRPELGEEWCGSWRLFWADGRPMAHDECPMAIALREKRSVRGYQAVAERPDGGRVSFVPYPTVVLDARGELVGAINVLIDVSDLVSAREELQAANAVKDEFLGYVSHELRTPVTTVFGNAQLLARRKDLPDDAAAMIADVATDAERLRDVVENLLVLGRGRRSVVDREPQVITHVVRDVVSVFSQRHPERVVTLEGGDRDLIVEAGAAHLQLLIGNLLSNADKYSVSTAPIDVIVRREEDTAAVLVLDRGIGFAPEEAEGLFRPFYRTPAAASMAGGVGIGLAACARIVSMLDGRLWAHPRDGAGSEFGFSLPATELQAD